MARIKEATVSTDVILTMSALCVFGGVTPKHMAIISICGGGAGRPADRKRNRKRFRVKRDEGCVEEGPDPDFDPNLIPTM